MKILNNKILNKAATFLLMVVLLCWNAVQVYAEDLKQIEYLYIGDDVITIEMGVVDCPSEWLEDDNIDNGNMESTEIVQWNEIQLEVGTSFDSITPFIDGSVAQGGYNVVSYSCSVEYDLKPFYVGDTVKGDLAFLPQFYVNTVVHGTGYNYALWDVFVDSAQLIMPDGTVFHGVVRDSNFYDSFYGTLEIGSGYSNTKTFVPSIFFKVSEYYVDSAAAPIIRINLRCRTNSASDANIGLSFSNAGWNIGKLQSAYGDLTQPKIDTIIKQNNTLLGKLNSWFESLFKRMDDKQNEQLHGYQDSTITEAANTFSSESDKLTALEGELSTQSNTYVSDYAAEGFDLGVLATLGSSLIFVTTWFTNFWNMGGVFTAALNFCFALSIVFFILRIKR